ncbi:TonB-dependent receptor [uncultured Phascolarctobacterium sp.]|uniref:TonB-dependent receptor plug domain-containing protein n=1 Tax=uncultured Phascolarctobacterium sp. TaxID=512296 RepID=UPI0026230ECA|nr:TonB-dependent receptor [uncultured Phascolarctobacterium sp.]
MQHFAKKSSLLIALCILSSINSSGNAAAADDLHQYNLDEYVVTATRTELTQKENPRSVEVITQEDIKNTGAISVRDALRLATNIDVISASHGSGENISIRGGNTNDVLILVNGRRVANESYFISLSTNAFALDRLNLSNVERIEILRGQASAIYGSGSMSGVINIITKKSEKPKASAGISTGTREMSNYYHFDTGKSGKFSASFDANFSKLRNIDDKAGKKLFNGPKQAYNLNIDYEMDENNSLNLLVDYDKENLESISYNFTARPPREALIPFKSERKTVGMTYTGKNANSNYSLAAFYSQLSRDAGSVDNAATDEKKYKSWNIEARDTVKTAENNKLTFGAEYRGDKATLYGGNNMKNSNQYSIYVQDEYRAGSKLLLTPAVRFDHHDSFGNHTSANLGATYFINDKARFKANYGSSYRAPSVDELYGSFNHGGIFAYPLLGNPDLKPEKVHGWEISYEQEFGDTTSAKLTYFDNKKDDAIDYKFTDSTYTYRKFYNIDSTSSKGIEFEVKHDLGNGFTVAGNYNWLNAVDDSDGSRIQYSARNTYTAKLMWTEPVQKEWNVTAWNKWYTDFQYSSTAIYSVNTFNFTVSKRWGEKYRVFAGIDNVFNKDLSDMGFYGRMWRLGAEMKF